MLASAMDHKWKSESKKQFNLKLLLLMILLTSYNLGRGQTVIANQGFEGLPTDNWSFTPPTQNVNTPQVLVGAANYGAGFSSSGSRSMRIGGGSTTCGDGSTNCLNGDNNGGDCNDNQNGRILQFQPVEISCYNNVRVSVAYRTDVLCSGEGQGFDSGDRIFFEVSENGGPFSIAATVNGFNNCVWNYATTSVNCAGPAVQNPFVYTVPPGRNTLAFRIRINVNRSDEVLYIDDVKITGNFSGDFNYPPIACAELLLVAPSIDINLVSGGTFSSSPLGLSLNSSSGNINPSISTPGNYTVNYIKFTEICASSTVTVGNVISTTPIYHD
jgi:hypothetical protein